MMALNSKPNEKVFDVFAPMLALIARKLEQKELLYSYLYVGVRNQGKCVSQRWFEINSNTYLEVSRYCRELMTREGMSFEIEFLSDPKPRKLDLRNKHNFNDQRGRKAAFVALNGEVKRYSSLEMIAKNLSFNRLAELCIGESEAKRFDWLNITLYTAEQFFWSEGMKVPVALYRGNQVVELADVNSQTTEQAALRMVQWLTNQVGEDGRMQYKYWPSQGEYSSANNTIRQWMATLSLVRSAKAMRNPRLTEIAELNLRHNLQAFFRKQGDLGYIYLDGSAKLGAIALAALAILESPFRKNYLAEEYALRRTVDYLHNPDGSFRTFLIPAERTDNQNFYSGEALLFWAVEYSISKNPALLNKIMSSFEYYRDWHLKNRNPAFVPWHTQAYYLVWQQTKDERLKDFIFEMNDWLLSMQQWETASHPDMRGRFYDPARPYFGPPHASSTGVYLEGLIDAFSLAKQTGSDTRAVRYRTAIVRGMRSILQLQFKDSVDCFYVRHVNKVQGGVRTTVYDNTIRVDNVQHALMALLKILSRFDANDYRLAGSVRSLNSPESDPTNKILFSTYDEKCSVLWCRDEVIDACSFTRVYNDGPWMAKSVIARSPRPEKGSVYFAKQTLGDELLALRNRSSQPSMIFAESENALALAKTVTCPVYEVDSLLETARLLADAARARTRARVIGVTGSVGKTSIKNALAQLLAMQGDTHATQANANDGWGVLDTLSNLPSGAQYAVMELGMLGVGSIKIKSQRIKPHVGIITNIHDAHLAYHSGQDSIAATKSGLLEGIAPPGTAILPRDSAWYDFLRGKAQLAGIQRLVSFGSHPEADFRLLKAFGKESENLVHANLLGKPFEFRIGATGEHWALNAMAILAAVHAVEADLNVAVNSMASIKPSFRRGAVLQVEKGAKRYVVIDDTWNASPASVVAALENLKSFNPYGGGRKILFLGDMLQLGKDEIDRHIALIDAIVSNGVEKVYTIGDLTSALFNKLPFGLKGAHIRQADLAANLAQDCVENGDVVLVKGSNAMEMWRVVKALRDGASDRVGTGRTAPSSCLAGMRI